jgi:anhydro-N-acetylmuramic acid kinase
MEFAKTHAEYGHHLGMITKEFINNHHLEVDFIASHGHTIFHQPESGFTSQIGDGSAIVAETSIPVVCDFRSMDVARGGQGAPLVPIGDALLFGDHKARVNLGGFSNLSVGNANELQAFDICPVNIVLNHLCNRIGKAYDHGGELAKSGQIIPELLVKLNQLKYYQQLPPKSLGLEWVQKEVFPLLDSSEKVDDMLRTMVEHAAIQISKTINKYCSDKDSSLFTGGGSLNDFLMERIRDLSQSKIVIPNSEIIEMKEAIVFAFLGLKRFLGEENILASYTGASKNSISGALYLP